MKTGAKLATILFTLVSLAHLMRLIYAMEITVDGYPVPQWVSIIGVLVPAGICLLLWREAR